MESDNESNATRDYPGTGRTCARNGDRSVADSCQENTNPCDVRIELVSVSGPEGERLHALQVAVVQRILARLDARQTHTPPHEGSGL